MEQEKAERAGGRPWRRLRARKLQANPLCEHCYTAACMHGAAVVVLGAKRCIRVATEVDHVLPIHKGGAELDMSNLQSLCSDCHHVKTADDCGHAKQQIGADGWPVQQ